MSELILRASRLGDGRASIEASLGERTVARDSCDLRSTDDRRRCAGVIRASVPALSIEAIERELLAIDHDSLPDKAPGADDPWPEPVPVGLPSVPPFPVELLPEPLQSWVSATAEATQTPADLAGLLSLAVCAGAVARRVEVAAGNGWREPLNLYVTVALDPGNRKSSVFRAALSPLREVERQLIEVAEPDVARANADRRMREAESKALEAKAAKGGKDAAEARERALELAEELAGESPPVLPKLLVDDSSPEAIETILASQDGRLVVAGAEGGVFDVMGGRYSSGAGNLDVFLKGHAADDLRVDRVTRGSIVVDRAALTLAYAVQPEILRGLGAKSSFRGRGLVGRFLYAVPESPLGRRRINPPAVPEGVAEGYAAAVKRLATIADPGDGAPWVLSLSTEARATFDDWQREVEPMLAPDAVLGSMTDWAGKLCGLTARMAAVMHLVAIHDHHEPWRVPIAAESVEAAVGLSRWAIPHAQAAIAMVGGETEGPVGDAAYVLAWLRDRAKPEVTRRDIGQHGRARFDGDPERLSMALRLLVDRGWLRPLDDDNRGPGRPSEKYAVHPSVPAGKSPSPSLPSASVPPWESEAPKPTTGDRVRGVV